MSNNIVCTIKIRDPTFFSITLILPKINPMPYMPISAGKLNNMERKIINTSCTLKPIVIPQNTIIPIYVTICIRQLTSRRQNKIPSIANFDCKRISKIPRDVSPDIVSER